MLHKVKSKQVRPEEAVKRARELYAEGQTIVQIRETIIREFGLIRSPDTIRRWIKYLIEPIGGWYAQST